MMRTQYYLVHEKFWNYFVSLMDRTTLKCLDISNRDSYYLSQIKNLLRNNWKENSNNTTVCNFKKSLYLVFYLLIILISGKYFLSLSNFVSTLTWIRLIAEELCTDSWSLEAGSRSLITNLHYILYCSKDKCQSMEKRISKFCIFSVDHFKSEAFL